MFDKFNELLFSGLTFIWGKILNALFNANLQLFKWVMDKANNVSAVVWENVAVEGILNFVSLVGTIVFVVSLPFLLTDIGKNIDQVNLRVVFTSLSEAIIYVFTIRWFPLVVFSIPIEFVKNTNFHISNPEEILLSSFESNGINIKPVGAALDAVGITFSNLLVLLIIVISAAVFLIMCFKLSADMLIHTISSVLYIPFIVRGDTKKIGEWFQMAVAISVTYIIQYIAMYIAILSLLSFDYIIGIVFIFVAIGAGRALKQWGHQTGTGSAISSSVHMMSQASYMLKGLIGGK